MLLTHPDIESRNDQEIKELEFIFNSHPCLNENNTPYQKSSDLSFSYHTGSISREKTDEWLQWKQVIFSFIIILISFYSWNYFYFSFLES